MKQLRTILTLVFLLGISLSVLAQQTKVKIKSKGGDAGMSMPYQASYSSQFALGNPAYSKMVLQIWKDYDNNTLDNSSAILADTVMAILADGTVIKGKDAFMSGLKAYRGGFTAVKSDVQAWLTVKSLDQNRETTCIWGTETDTKSDGTTQAAALHELWFFNKDGKVDLVRQFLEQPPRQ